MTAARSVSDVLDDHVTLEVECLDRMYLNVFRGHRGAVFASSALMDPISKTFVAWIHRFCRDHDVELVGFAKGQRKDDLAHEYLAGFEAQHGPGSEGVLFIGRAQEKTRVLRTEKRRNPLTGATYSWIVSSSGW